MIKALLRWPWRRRRQPVVDTRAPEDQIIVCRRYNADGSYEVEFKA